MWNSDSTLLQSLDNVLQTSRGTRATVDGQKKTVDRLCIEAGNVFSQCVSLHRNVNSLNQELVSRRAADQLGLHSASARLCQARGRLSEASQQLQISRLILDHEQKKLDEWYIVS